MTALQTPADLYQELFVAVQRERVFPDSKTFVDCVPHLPPPHILDQYRSRCHQAGIRPPRIRRCSTSPSNERWPRDTCHLPDNRSAGHIDGLWDILTRHPAEHPPRCSLLPLPCDYVVPGGRFAELYYWDSYFTMLGLADSGRHRLLRAMLDNFAHLIDTYGYVPNGTRTYYLSRSQPPVFALMVELAEECGVCDAAQFVPQLLREHAFWMDGSAALGSGVAHRRAVGLTQRRGAQPLLGRPRFGARGILARRRGDRRGHAAPRRRSASRSARRVRVGLGFQFALARRSRSEQHPHHEHHARGPQRLPAPARGADRAPESRRWRRRDGARLRAEGPSTAGGDRHLLLERTARRVPGLRLERDAFRAAR